MSERTKAELAARIADLSPEKRALLADRLKSRPAAAAAEPIAVVGMGCRFPGADGKDAFWRVLRDGVDAIDEVPADRWNVDALYNSDPLSPGTVTTRWGGFLADIDRFDAAFFGIAPREAVRMDPQQRLLLEVAWHAFEDAGQTKDMLAGSRTGVFVGIHSHSSDYAAMQFADVDGMDAFTATGTAHNFMSGRLSYWLDLHGPSLVIDTACSSSLVAVHLACQSLRAGECAMALAGGVNLMVTPHFTIAASRMHMLSPDGRCKAFDESANGFVRSEGCGAVVLKRLSDARAAGDRILAVIRGTAANQDGRTNGITAPNGQAQQAVIREALRVAGLDPSVVTYVEAHGTGTALGDPIEVESLATVFGAVSPGSDRCAVGSAKTNLGHLEGAAGIAGLIKVVLCLQHRQIPPVVHFRQLNPHIQIDGTRLEIPTTLRDWRVSSGQRVAGLSSFGWSGTNAHAVLEEAPVSTTAMTKDEEDGRLRLFPLSAASTESLAAISGTYADWLESGDAPSWGNLLFSAAQRRSHLPHRLAVVAGSRPQLIERLRTHASGQAGPYVAAGRASAERPGVAFVFPGQGSQWLGMGRDLLNQEPVFRAAVEQCDRAIAVWTGWSVIAELTAGAPASRLAEIDVVQPTLFAIQVGLAALWRSWGIEPDAVVGHSMGEVAAACVAGALSLDDAARVICLRSRLLKTVSGRGAMAVVELSFEAARAAIAGSEDRLAIAVCNSRRSTVISGDPEALERLTHELRRKDVFCRPVKVDVASHSPQMDPLRADLLAALDGISPRPSTVPIYSTVTESVTDGSGFTASYWARNLREPVLFGAALERLIGDGHRTFIEVSPHPILLPAIETVLQDAGVDALAVASLRRDEDERTALLVSLGRVFTNGGSLCWPALVPEGCFVAGPSYPWQRERFWLEPGADADVRRPAAGGHDEPVAAQAVASDSGRQICRVAWAPRAGSAAMSLRVDGERVVPVSVLLDLVCEAGQSAMATDVTGLRDVMFSRPLLLESVIAGVQIEFGPTQDGEVAFRVMSGADGVFVQVATGRVCGDAASASPENRSAQDIGAMGDRISGEAFYQRLADARIDVEPALQVIDEIRQHGGRAVASAVTRPGTRARRVALFDAALQVAATLARDASHDGPAAFSPTTIAELRYRSPSSERLQLLATCERDGDTATIAIETPDQPWLSLQGVRFERRSIAPLNADTWLYEPAWPVVPRAAAAAPARGPRTWLLLADAQGFAESLKDALAARGDSVMLAHVDTMLADVEAHVQLDGIVHCCDLDAVQPTEAPDGVAALIEHRTAGAVRLVQALTARPSLGTPKLWIVTRGAQPVVAGAAVRPLQSPLWGFGRVVAEEHPDLWGGLIDLDPVARGDEAADVAAEISEGVNERQVAFRQGQRHAARLVTWHPESPAGTHVRSDATYLITGGLTGVGLRVGRWLVERGARRLILMGRTPLPERRAWTLAQPPAVAGRIQAVRGLEALGASVNVVSIDVADESAMKAFFDSFQLEGWPPIRGVVHSAAVIDDALIGRVDPDAIGRVLRPKIAGALVLDRVFADAPLDFFVLFSSLGSTLGYAGQAIYAAANAFLDALAHARAARGLTAHAINWAGWSGVGLAQTSDGARRTIEELERDGIGSFGPEEGLEAFWRILRRQTPQVALIPLDVRKFRASRRALSDAPYFSAILSAEAEPVTRASAPDDVRTMVARAQPEERRGLLEGYLQQQLALVLKLAVERIDVRTPLGTLGLESLLALELRNRLEPALHLKLSATLVWSYPTVRELATFLAGRMSLELDRTDAPAAEATVRVEQTPADLDSLSEDEALLVLTERTRRVS